MVTRDQFKTLVKGMKAVYPQTNFIPDKESFDVWYAMLCDLEYQDLSRAIQHHMQTSRFIPTIADLRDNAAKYEPQALELNEQEAWARVRKAVGNSTYHAEEEFKKLPTILQKAVGAPATLREWAKANAETLESVEASLFIKNLRNLEKKAHENVRLQPELRAGLTIGIEERKVEGCEKQIPLW